MVMMMAVTVWRVDLDDPRLATADRIAWLDPQERRRYSAFAAAPQGSRFAAAHTALRDILGRTIERHPHTIAYRYGAAGRPSIPDGTVDFSLTHCDGVALISVSDTNRTGIDAEIATRSVSPQMLKIFATPTERARLVDASDYERLRLWVAKEAVLKASGVGFQGDPLSVVLAVSNMQGLALDCTCGRRFWRLAQLSAGVDVIAFLAIEPRPNMTEAIRIINYGIVGQSGTTKDSDRDLKTRP